MTRRPSRTRRLRHGAILLVAIVLTIITAGLTVSLLQLVPTRMKAVRTELRQLQAEWLVESGLERAAWRLRADPQYTGETWNPSPEELGLADPATVRIQVDKAPGHSNQRLVRVRADYPSHPYHRVRRSKQIIVELSR